MKALTNSQAKEWCDKKNIQLTNTDGLVLDSSTFFRIDIPKDAGARVALVKEHIQNLDINGEVLVWIQNFDVWPSSQWEHLFNRFRLSYGQEEILKNAPAQVINSEDRDCLTSILVYSILMLWDCYLVTNKGPILFYSHDEFVLINKSAGH